MKLKYSIIAEEFFQISLITYLILLLAETIKEGFVSYFLDLNIILGVVIISGLCMILTHDDERHLKKEGKKKLSSRDFEFFFIMSVAGALLIYYKTEELGTISLILTAFTAVIIFLLSYLIMTDET